METARQNYLNRIIVTHGIHESWIAERLTYILGRNISPQTLNYQLKGAKEISEEFYTNIIQILKDANVIYQCDDQCKELLSLAAGLTANLNFQLSTLLNESQRTIENDVIEPDEKKKLSVIVIDLKRSIERANCTIRQIEKLIEE